MKLYVKLLFPFLICSTACTSNFNKLLTNPSDAKHPATSVFKNYVDAVNESKAFDSDIIQFFSPNIHNDIKKSKGWHKRVYTSSYQAIKDGNCLEIYLETLQANRVIVNCKGDFKYKPYFLPPSIESMHMKVYIHKIKNTWYISKSGFYHTYKDKGQIKKIDYGIKFKTWQ